MGEKMQGEYRIPESNLRQLAEKIEKLNKKAAKLACEPITYSVKDIETITIQHGRNAGKVFKWAHILLIGESPVLEGWRFIATLQHMQDVPDNIIRTISNEFDIPAQFRDRKICDHCQVNRYRRDTFLVQHIASGMLWQVGRSCLKDFLGHQDPHRVAQICELMVQLHSYTKALEDFDPEDYDFEKERVIGQPRYMLDLQAYLVHVSCAIRAHGWISKSKARESFDAIPTCETAYSLMMDLNNPHVPAEVKAKLPKPIGADEIMADECIQWLEELDVRSRDEVLNDYLHNLRVIGSQGAIEMNMLGYAASIVMAYCKEKGKLLPGQAALHNRKESRHLGEPGKREEFFMRLSAIKHLENSSLLTFEDQNGNIAKWFCSNFAKLKINEGSWYLFKATVKDHGEFKGVKETRFNRCSDFKEVAPEVTERIEERKAKEEQTNESLKSQFSFLNSEVNNG